jgi:hypothetical protein
MSTPPELPGRFELTKSAWPSGDSDGNPSKASLGGGVTTLLSGFLDHGTPWESQPTLRVNDFDHLGAGGDQEEEVGGRWRTRKDAWIGSVCLSTHISITIRQPGSWVLLERMAVRKVRYIQVRFGPSRLPKTRLYRRFPEGVGEHRRTTPRLNWYCINGRVGPMFSVNRNAMSQAKQMQVKIAKMP